MTKRAKAYLIILLICSLIFGSAFYIITALYIIYIIIYNNAINKGKVFLQTKVNTYTLRQKDTLTFFYTLKVNFSLPFIFFITLSPPYYIVPFEGEKEKRKFTRKSTLKDTIKFIANRRGVYDVGKFVVHISDPLSLFVKKKTVSEIHRIFVFPYIVPFERLNIYLSEPVSGIKAKFQLNRDYTSIAGVRDYTTQDPLSMIHWKQTAHRGKLTVKELDFTASKRIQIVLDLYKKNLQFQDASSAIAASIAYYAAYHHLPVGAIINGKPSEDVKIGTGSFHLMQLLKALALAGNDNADDTLKFINSLPLKIGFGTELFFIEKDLTKKIMLALLKLKPYVSRLNIVLLPDNTFVLPHEKPPYYYFKEAPYNEVLGRSKEALARDGIYVYPILGKDYASKLEKVR